MKANQINAEFLAMDRNQRDKCPRAGSEVVCLRIVQVARLSWTLLPCQIESTLFRAQFNSDRFYLCSASCNKIGWRYLKDSETQGHCCVNIFCP